MNTLETAIGFIICPVVLVTILIAVAFLHTLDGALRRVAPARRLMAPHHIWLNLIPVFHYIWMIVTVRCVSRSLAAEFAARGIDAGDCCEDEGKAYAIFRCLGGIAYAATFALQTSGVGYMEIPAFIWAWVITPPALVCFVIYWVRIAGAARRLDADDRHSMARPGHRPSEAITTKPR